MTDQIDEWLHRASLLLFAFALIEPLVFRSKQMDERRAFYRTQWSRLVLTCLFVLLVAAIPIWSPSSLLFWAAGALAWVGALLNAIRLRRTFWPGG